MLQWLLGLNSLLINDSYQLMEYSKQVGFYIIYAEASSQLLCFCQNADAVAFSLKVHTKMSKIFLCYDVLWHIFKYEAYRGML